MRTTKKVISAVLAACMLASTSVVSSFAAKIDESSSVGANTTYSNACEALDNEFAYSGNDLGATYAPERTTFKVWSPTATKIVLNLYKTGSDSEQGAANLGNYELSKVMDGDKFTGVWAVTVDGDLKNLYYTYSITVVPTTGGEEETNETQDIYSVATGVNGNRSMICDLASTDPEGWDNDSHVLMNDITDSSVYELHIKDFSYDSASGVSEANRGKYLAFTETGTTLNGEGEISTCIDYLKDLGVTTVQLNPFYDFQSINEMGSSDQFNWGYDPQNYNVPEGSYSSNPYDGNVRIKECKQMIQALHNAGISVVMDVVYNHTYATDSCFQKTVPNYYYRMTDATVYGCPECHYQSTTKEKVCPQCGYDTKSMSMVYQCTECGHEEYKSGSTCAECGKATMKKKVQISGFSNGSGCGNECATERAMFRQFLINSCRYWVDEYHIDGFRFDLMGLMDCEAMNEIRDNLDEVNTKISMWGEGWTGGTSTYPTNTYKGNKFYPATQANASKLSPRIAFFNDAIRDSIKGSVFDINSKGFIEGGVSEDISKGLYYGVRANTTTNKWTAQAPVQCVTYASCHDNATLYDQICASTGLAKYGERTSDTVKINKLAAAILYTSQGITFSQAGEEMCRTKYGDTNSYKSSPEINKLNWQNIIDYADVVSYYKGMMQIKKNFSPFTCDDMKYSDESHYVYNTSDSVLSSTFGFTVQNDTPGEWSKMAVMYNNATKTAKVTLKDKTVTDWVVIANGDTAGIEKLEEVSGSTFQVPARSAVIAVDKASYDAIGLKSDMGSVKVNYVYEMSGEKLADSIVVQGKIGNNYQVTAGSAVPNVYVLNRVVGNEKGKFASEPAEVTYYYSDYVPESVLKADMNRDGKVNILDVTEMQKHIAKLITLPDDLLEKFDVDYDGSRNILDCTMLMKYFAKLPVSSGNITVNYYYFDTDGTKKNLTKSVEISGRTGDEYKTDEYRVVGYAVDETKKPKNAEGKIPYGSVVVDYYYTTSSLDINLHVKHNGSLTWAPSLWIWGSNLKGVDSDNYTQSKTWPGDTLTDTDGDGWFDYNFTYNGAGTYNVIVSNNKATQTVDYKGFVDNDLWIIIDDAAVEGGQYLKFYTENPEVNPDAPAAQHYIG